MFTQRSEESASQSLPKNSPKKPSTSQHLKLKGGMHCADDANSQNGMRKLKKKQKTTLHVVKCHLVNCKQRPTTRCSKNTTAEVTSLYVCSSQHSFWYLYKFEYQKRKIKDSSMHRQGTAAVLKIGSILPKLASHNKV